ncbi:MAG: DUF1736 domain-containing protein [Bacteroidetes bacterium]|nr:DUF1736 domain-containing protein [Bacteroidota bacterium]
MKKKQKAKLPQPDPSAITVAETTQSSARNYLKEYLFITALAFTNFGASIFNKYALDDYIVLVKNTFVQRGFAGISKILSKDTFAGMTDANLMVLSGGRYRPLSLVTFAIENQFFDNNPGLSHFINVLLYALTGIVLLHVLVRIFSGNNLLALCTTVLFMVLPIHSEAVINIKGRDDIMCFLFFLMAVICLFKYVDSTKLIWFISATLLYFLSLLSKETALTFVLIFPLLLYYFSPLKATKIIQTSLGFIAGMLLFLALRYAATHDNGAIPSNDIFNNPFAFMNGEQHYATIFLTWLIYLKLIFYPLHLSYDYNFNQIPATTFSDWRVILSLVIYTGGLVLALFLFRKKSIYSFAILFFGITFSILSNLFFNIGAPIAERFMYMSSLGICIAVIKFLMDVVDRFSTSAPSAKKYTPVLVLVGLIVIGSAYLNIARCADWEDSNTLFIADVKNVPQNSKANLNASLAYLKLSEDSINKTHNAAMLDSAKKYIEKALAIYPARADGYLNMGVIYSWKDNFDSAEVWWDRARNIEPNSATLKGYEKVLSDHYYKKGLKKGVDKDFAGSIADLQHAYRYDTLNAALTYNLGGAFYTVKEYEKAKLFWKKTLRLDPNNQGAIGGLNALRYTLRGK